MNLLLANRALGCRELATFITACLAIVVLSLLGAPPAQAADVPERLRVADPYLELHTGPGRGFPVFFVVARDEWIEIQLRSTDWYKVRTDGGKEGWVHRSQLANTFTEAGVQKTFRDVALDDYLARRLQMGAAWGQFKKEPMLKLWTSYRLSDTLHVEGTIGQVQGTFSGTDIWHVNLVAEPLADQRLSPFFSARRGQVQEPAQHRPWWVRCPPTPSCPTPRVGVRYYLTDRFIARADYTLYTAFVGDTRTGEYRAWTLGLAFFF